MKQLARARARLTTLLSRCALDGPTDALWPQVAPLPALADPWPDGDADVRAALHHEVFGRQVFPYESVVRGPDGLLGGPLQDAVRRAYRRSGMPAPPPDVEPDHLGVELANLAWLAAAEADALDDDRADEAERVATIAADFAVEHLLRWLPLVADALAPWPWHHAIAELALDLARLYRADPTPPPPPLPAPDPAESPRRFAEHHVVPARVGFILTAHRIDALARSLDLPRGFGSRADTLENLVCAALDHGKLDALVAGLRER